MKWEPDRKTGIRTINGDCLDVLRQMPDQCIDAIITDPPYGVDFQYDEYQDTPEAWFELIDAFMPEALRVAKRIVLPTCSPAGEDFLRKYNPLWRICWDKGATSSRTPIGFRDWELMYYFGEKPPQLMHDTVRAPATSGPTVAWHPCPKPLRWASWLVRRLTRPGEIVMDPFMGSGTMGLASRRLRRRFVGVELSKNYFNRATKRVLYGDSAAVVDEGFSLIKPTPKRGTRRVKP